MEGVRKGLVTIVLDGASGVGKSALFKTSRYATISRVHEVMVNEVKYQTRILDTNCQFPRMNISFPYSALADVIIELFAIDDLPSLQHAIHVNIPYIQEIFPKVPVLLVGTKADLRGVEEKHLLFPCELGPFLARCLGAVKYIECSSITNFNVHQVLEEAVRSHLSNSDFEFIGKYASIDIMTDRDSKWARFLWDKFGLTQLVNPLNWFPAINLCWLLVDLNCRSYLAETFLVIERKKSDRPTVFLCRVLEFERLQLSYGLPCTTVVDVYEGSPPTCTLWCVFPSIHVFQCRSLDDEFHKILIILTKKLAHLRFVSKNCESIANFLLSTYKDQLLVRSLIIVNCSGTLDFSFLAKLTALEYMIIVNTAVDLATLTFPTHLHSTMKHLVLNNCGITQATNVPYQIGNLVNLEILNLANNKFKKIPTTLGSLKKLHTLLIDHENVYFPPPEVLKRSARDIINYFEALEEYPVLNTESKLIVAGEEGVGKSTLIKAMRRGSFWLTKNEPPPKTDGVDISVLPLKDIQCKVYDLAGDVEYLNTHSLFLSSNTLHLLVYDLSRVIVDKVRSVDHLCRLELWLKTIASQDPKSKVILVGTHADHPLVNREISMKNRKLLAKVLIKYCSSHRAFCRTDPCEECFICNPEKCPENLKCLKCLMTDTSNGGNSKTLSDTTCGQIPHILGYFEVSSIKKYPSSLLSLHNTNVEELKSFAATSISNIMKTTGTDQIPKQWLSFRESVAQNLSSDDDLKQQPLVPLSLVYDIALTLEIHEEERVKAMLRFFHSQGTFLWYEDLPEMKDIVIIDPQWLSDQLRTLISHRPSVSSICDGVLHLSEFSIVWPQMSDANRQKLLALFRNVGLCLTISDTQELFPCNLPVGWPDREIWPPVPKPRQNQTCLLFKFSFVPPSFFPNLIVEVNKKNKTFTRNIKPLYAYYRFNIVYIRKDQIMSTFLNDHDAGAEEDAPEDDDNSLPIQHPGVLHKHRVHYELMPYNNSLTVAVRGPDPPSIIPGIRSTIETVKRRRYPGITYSESMLCPECVMKGLQPPASFKYDAPHDGVCSRGHDVGSNQDIFKGDYNSAEIVPLWIAQTGRVAGEALEDHLCPKLFVVLPINLECLSLKDRVVYSYFRDGFAVHLLCECPGQWHFLDSPGFRVGKPKELFVKYGGRVCKALRFISTLSIPIIAAASLDPHCKVGAAVGIGAESVCQDLQSLLDSYLDKYPHLKPLLDSSKDDLGNLKSSSDGLQRSELSRFLEVEAKGRNFGPLVCTYVDKGSGHGEWLWLCEEHCKRFEIVQREN